MSDGPGTKHRSPALCEARVTRGGFNLPCNLAAGHPGQHATVGDECFGDSTPTWLRELEQHERAEQPVRVGVTVR